MRRTEFREKVIHLLYINSMDGSFEADDFSKEILERYDGILSNLIAIDDIIAKNLVRYTIDRLNLVDLAILRNATYEMAYTKLPKSISINEAINLTKKLSNLEDDQAKRFNNKLLDNIRKFLEK
ncbi:transcription antitermination factor NusB [Candidatus Izemoplasma sp. B36]|uniref:transcription antitermination factor NusB n=1 Tax=Candidatus Izemoplasma sp. B36 TaxID=3242468 RepID=UPI003556548B